MRLHLVLIVIAILTSCKTSPSERTFHEAVNASSFPAFGLFELSLTPGTATWDNPFLDVMVHAEFRAPDGKTHRVRGFYYGRSMWMIRFRPDVPGPWSYRYTFSDVRGLNKQGTGKFLCSPATSEGPLQRSTISPYRWVSSNGRAYYPLGLQDCVSNRGVEIEDFQIDGEARSDPGRIVSLDEYFTIYGRAGFNLFRFSQRNCSYPLFDGLRYYREAESAATDRLLIAATTRGFRVMFGFFGYHGQWNDGSALHRVRTHLLSRFRWLPEGLTRPDDQHMIDSEKRFVEYCVARWGVYVDFWQLLNERKASDRWTNLIATHLRDVDSSVRPVATSWERPQLSDIDINTPHWYESENERTSDSRVVENATAWKTFGKPVLVGEHGNRGMNWDPLSARRMRIRSWTALFQEIGLIFWNTSWSKAGMFEGHYTPEGVANIYLGPEERRFTKILSSFSARLDASVLPSTIRVSLPDQARGYGLLGDTVSAAYIHHFGDHSSVLQNLTVEIDVPRTRGPWTGEWIDPATGRVIERFGLPAARRFMLLVPPFNIDIAMLVVPQS